MLFEKKDKFEGEGEEEGLPKEAKIESPPLEEFEKEEDEGDEVGRESSRENRGEELGEGPDEEIPKEEKEEEKKSGNEDKGEEGFILDEVTDGFKRVEPKTKESLGENVGEGKGGVAGGHGEWDYVWGLVK